MKLIKRTKIIFVTILSLFVMNNFALGQWTAPDVNGHIYNTNPGNVGIGTTNPGAKLDVNGTGNFNDWVGFANGSMGKISWGSGRFIVTSVGSNDMSLGTDNFADRLYIKASSGNIGIGTTSPGAKLDIAADSGYEIKFSGLGNGNIWGEKTMYLISSEEIHFGSGGSNSQMVLKNGNVGIGTTNPGSKLAVNGTITAREVIVDVTLFPDFVFEDSYKLMPLSEVEKFIKKNKHLPEIPSEKEAKAKGIGLGEMQTKLLQKIEELTLYVIEQNKKLEKLDKLEKENEILKKRMSALEKGK
jgi:hypothetical protein